MGRVTDSLEKCIGSRGFQAHVFRVRIPTKKAQRKRGLNAQVFSFFSGGGRGVALLTVTKCV